MDLRDKEGLTEQEFLAQYRPGNYKRPSVASDIVIFTITDAKSDSYRRLPEKELRVLLIKRGGHPYLGCWALPGGFVQPEETVGEAANRELREETGVTGVYLEQMGIFSDPGRDPRMWVISCAHLALIDSGRVTVRAGDDAQKAAWFQMCYGREDDRINGMIKLKLELSCGESKLSGLVGYQWRGASLGAEDFKILENAGLAFDHAKIIACALERLRGQVETTHIVFHLMPETFTLTELQQVYQVLLGRPLLNAAFRRKIAPFVIETKEFTENAGHRPSRLYRYNGQA